MPALFQLLYPLKGSVVGIKSTEKMEQAIAGDPVLQQLMTQLQPAAEQKFLRQYALLFSLSQDAHTGLQNRATQMLMQIPHAGLRDAMVEYFISHPDPEVRRTASAAIADVADPQQRDALIQKLVQDKTWLNRARAVSLVGLLSTDAIRDAVIEQLILDPSVEVRREATSSLHRIQNTALLSELLPKLVHDASWEIREQVAKNLYRLPNAKKREEMSNLLSLDRSETVRAVILGPRHSKIDRPEVLAALLIKPHAVRDSNLAELIRHPEPTVRQNAALAIDVIQDPALRDKMIHHLLQDCTSRGHRSALSALPFLQNSEVRDRIIAALTDDADINTRLQGAQLLSHIQNKILRAATVRKFLSQKEHWMVRREALQQVLTIQDPPFVIAWIKHLTKDPEQEIRRLAVLGANKLSDLAMRDDLLTEFCNSSDLKVRKTAASMLSSMSNPVQREQLIERLLQDTSLPVQHETIRHLPVLSNASQRNTLIQKLVASEHPSVRSQMVRLINHVENPQLRDKLIMALMGDEKEEIRLIAAGLIERVHHTPLRDQLLEENFNNPQNHIRQTAVRLLALLSQTARRDALIESNASDDNMQIRQAAARLIPDITDEQRQWRLVQKLLKDPEITVRLLAVQSLGGLVNDTLQAIHPHTYLPLFQKAIGSDFSQKNIPLPAALAAFHPLRQSDLDGGEFHELISEFGKVLTHAIHRREYFTNVGGEPLSAQGIEDYFKNNLAPVFNSITVAGRGSIMDKFDQKPEKFERYLRSMNRLMQDDDLIQQLSQVCRLPGPNGTRNSADYTKIIELSEGFIHLQRPEVLKPHLEAMRQHKIADSRGLAQQFLKLLAEESGLSPQEISAIPPERFNAWNLKYVHLIPSALKILPPRNQQQLMDIIKSTLTGQFPKLLADPQTAVGKANQQTRAAFEQEQLNFDRWLNYDKPLFFKTYEHPLELKLWKRQPEHDLFQGTYAQSCVSLDNQNGRAILEALLHQCAQLLEIRDQFTHQPVGKVLLYWAKDQVRHEPVLVADNVQFREGYQHSMQTREGIRRWLVEYGEAVAGKRVTVLLGSRYNRIPTKDMESRDYTLKVLGDTDNHHFYFNSLGTGWSHLEKTYPTPMFRLAKG